MKQLIIATLITLAASLALAEKKTGDVHVNVKGMVCAFCSQGLTKTFKKLPEVETVHVNLEEKFVHLKLKKDQSLDSEKILNLIKEAGYEGSF